MIDPDTRFPIDRFERRRAQIVDIAQKFVREGLLDRVVQVLPDDPRHATLLRKYAGWPVRETHDCYGVGLVSYLYGFDEARTRYLLHYDADMLLHQAAGYHWPDDGVAALERDTRAIAATPRVSAPFAEALGRPDSSSLAASHPDLKPRNGVWPIGWFSARCFLLDLDRLRRWLPLLSPFATPRYFAEVVARKTLERGYPPAMEMLVHERAKREGAYRVDLVNEGAFVIHPNDKGARFLKLLPTLIASIARGDVPLAQRGHENVVLEAWERTEEFAPTQAVRVS